MEHAFPKRIAGEGIDADYVEVSREFSDPSYAICPICNQETDANSFCADCDSFTHEHRPRATLDQLMVKYPNLLAPFAELKRTGTGSWQ